MCINICNCNSIWPLSFLVGRGSFVPPAPPPPPLYLIFVVSHVHGLFIPTGVFPISYSFILVQKRGHRRRSGFYLSDFLRSPELLIDISILNNQEAQTSAAGGRRRDI